MSETSVSLENVSDGELLELVVPSDSPNRRILVMWLYLRERPQTKLEEFDRLLIGSAEKEMQRRANATKG